VSYLRCLRSGLGRRTQQRRRRRGRRGPQQQLMGSSSSRKRRRRRKVQQSASKGRRSRRRRGAWSSKRRLQQAPRPSWRLVSSRRSKAQHQQRQGLRAGGRCNGNILRVTPVHPWHTG
jgi:hypothetical protein